MNQIETYRSRGWNIIPLQEGSKLPKLEWLQYQQEKYTGTFNEKDNIAIILGAISNNLVVLDFDFSDYETIKKLLPCAWNETILIRTKRGVHAYFQSIDSAPRTCKLEYKNHHIDIKSEGGYVVAPPSIVDGFEYQQLNKCDKVCQLDFHKLATTWEKMGVKGIGEKSKGSKVQLSPDSYLSEGKRNDQLFKLACGIYNYDMKLKPDILFSYIWLINETKCQPALPEQEVKALVQSAIKRIQNSERW